MVRKQGGDKLACMYRIGKMHVSIHIVTMRPSCCSGESRVLERKQEKWTWSSVTDEMPLVCPEQTMGKGVLSVIGNTAPKWNSKAAVFCYIPRILQWLNRFRCTQLNGPFHNNNINIATKKGITQIITQRSKQKHTSILSYFQGISNICPQH